MNGNTKGAPVGTPQTTGCKGTDNSETFQGCGDNSATPKIDSKGTQVTSNIQGIAQALKDAIADPSVNDTLEKYGNYVVDVSEKYDEPHYSLFREGIGTLPRGDIQAIKAKSKSGKSFLCSIFMASLLGCSEFSFDTKENNPTVLYFDTEQNMRNTAKLARRVHTLLEWPTDAPHEGFRAFALRTMDTAADRLECISEIVKVLKPTAIFIDGIADLIEDFNNVVESAKLINDLMKLSADNDCCVCCVLHTNKGKDDHGMKGHLGTMLLQKVSDVFEVEKSGDTFNVTQTDCRNKSISDFAFVLDGHAIPHATESVKDMKGIEKLNAIKETLTKVFANANSESLSYTELTSFYQNQGGCSESTAKRHVGFALSKGALQCDNQRYKMG